MTGPVRSGPQSIAARVDGLPYAEVGTLLHSSEAAARRSAADGLANLRRAYRTEEDDKEPAK